jgi:hypothetical protein
MGWTAEDETASKRRAAEIIQEKGRKDVGDTVKGLLVLAIAVVFLSQCVFKAPHHITPPANTTAPPAPAAPTGPKAPTSLRSEKDVDGVFIKGPVLTVSMMNSTPGGDDDAYYLDIAALQAMQIGFAIHDGVTDRLGGVKAVNIILRTPMMDRLGNALEEPIFMATYSMADLKAANIGRLGPVGFLNLARLVQVGRGPSRRFINTWCLKNPGAGPFCGRAVGL